MGGYCLSGDGRGTVCVVMGGVAAYFLSVCEDISVIFLAIYIYVCLMISPHKITCLHPGLSRFSKHGIVCATTGFVKAVNLFSCVRTLVY